MQCGCLVASSLFPPRAAGLGLSHLGPPMVKCGKIGGRTGKAHRKAIGCDGKQKAFLFRKHKDVSRLGRFLKAERSH